MNSLHPTPLRVSPASATCRRNSGVRSRLWLPIAAFCAACPVLLGTEPSWWAPVKNSSQVQDNYAAATAGQLKNMAVRAMDEMNLRYVQVGGAGDSIKAMVANWRLPAVKSKSNDFAIVTVKQVKQVATKFYDRLAELQMASPGVYPWTSSGSDSSAACVGQIKTVFAFALVDGAFTADGDADGDGLTNAQELALGLNPLKADSFGDGVLDGNRPGVSNGTYAAPEKVGLGVTITFPAEGGRY